MKWRRTNNRVSKATSPWKSGATRSFLQIRKFKRRRRNCGKVKPKYNIIRKKQRTCGDNWKSLITFRRLHSWKMSKRTNKEFLNNFRMKTGLLLKFSKTKRKRFKVCPRKMITKRRYMIWTLNWNKRRIICDDFSSSKEKMSEAWKYSMKRSSCWRKSAERWLSWSRKRKRERPKLLKKTK